MRRTLAFMLGTVLVLLAGCGSPKSAAPASARTPETKTLTVGHHLDPTTLNPETTTVAAFQSVYAHISEQLVIFDADKSTIRPWLAESWTWVDSTTLELKLRKGVMFTNGEEFDAEAAKYSIDLLAQAKVYAIFLPKGIYKETAIVDKHTVRVSFHRPYAAFMGMLARGGFVYPPKYRSEVGSDAFGQKPIGTGPFVLKEWIKDSHITLDRNPDYWRGAHPIERVVYKVIAEETARIAALEKGEIDIALNVPVSAVKRLEGNQDVKVHTIQGLRKFAARFETVHIKSPLEDPRVRRALNLAVDKDAIARSLFQGQADPLPGQWLLSGEFGHNPKIQAYPYDPEQAKNLLAEAGYPNGVELQLTYTVGRYALDKELGEIVSSYLEKVGVKVKQRALEWGAFQNLRGGEQVGTYIAGALVPSDPHFNYMLFTKGQIYETHRFPARYDELVDKASRETESSAREAIYHQLAEMVYEDPNALFLVVPKDIYAVNKRVDGFTPRVDQVLWLFDVTLK